ncbi:MAG: two-component system sensor histidine kinase AtoS [Desulfotomaculales bacterium]
MAVRRRLGFSRQLLLFTLILLSFPGLLTFYMLHVMQRAERELVAGDTAKCVQAIRLLDESFDSTFEDILKKQGVPPDARNRDKVKVLNAALKPVIDKVAAQYPSLFLGFYSLEHDVILDGHSETYGENFSLRRKEDIQRTIEERRPVNNVVGVGGSGLVETYRPLIRNGKVIGAVVAQENMRDIYARLARVRREAYLAIAGGLVIGVGGFFILLNRFLELISRVKVGLTHLESDLSYRLPPAFGELGEIAAAINHLANRLEQMRSYNEIILNSVDAAIIALDNDARVVAVNPVALQLFGLPDASVLGHSLYEIFPDQGNPLRESLEGALYRRETVRDSTILYQAPDGAHHLMVGTGLLSNQRGNVIGAVLTAKDVTEHKRLEDRVKRQERLAALGKFVAGVAHEIRNPLTSISGYIQHWQRRGQPTPQSLATVGREIMRLNTIVDKLLFFARPAKAKFQAYDLNSLVKQVLQFFGEAHDDRVQLSVCVEPDLPPARLDPEAMKQVLTNIIYNSYQAMPEGGALVVETALADEQYLVITVTDTGVGIPPENLPRIFDPFFTTRAQGSGLGLALAHEIVQAHGGYIEVESQVGVGTTMHVYIPRFREDDTDAADSGR